MRNTFKWHEDWLLRLTEHQVDILEQTPKFNENHLAKVLLGHIETLKICVHNLIEERDNLKELISEDVESRR